MEPELARKKIASGIKNYFKKAGFKKAVFGLSGGIDSAVLAFLLSESLGAKNVFALHLPEKIEPKNADLRHSLQVVAETKINFSVFPIGKACEGLEKTVWVPSKAAKANIRARVRMAVLYSFANTKKALVAGTSNRSELLLGYFTKYGDAGADLLPLAFLYKTEVFELARHLNVPRQIIKKKPSAGLWKGQTDEKEIGHSYEKIDAILRAGFDEGMELQKIEKLHGKKATKRIFSMAEANSHKAGPAWWKKNEDSHFGRLL